MPKIALVEHSGTHACYDCGGAVAHHISDWADVTSEEYNALEDFVVGKNTLIVKYPTTENTTMTIRQAVAAAMKLKAERQRKREAAAARKVERDRKKRLADEEAERREFERLAAKFDGGANA